MAKYDFSKVSRETLEDFARTAANEFICTMEATGSGGTVLRQARVRTPEEVALELAEYCCDHLGPEVGLVDNNKTSSYDGCKIRRLTDEYRKLVHK